MTAFEYVYLLNEFEAKLLNSLIAQFSLVSAFLVAAYAVSHQLSMRMLIVVVAIYTIIGLIFSFNIWSTWIDMVLLSQAALEADASGLIELPPTAMLSSQAVGDYKNLSRFTLFLQILIYSLSLIFAFGVRRRGLTQLSPPAETSEPNEAQNNT